MRVLDRHRPTLPELAAPLPRPVRRGVAGLAALVVLAAVVALAAPEDRGLVVVREQAPAFNFARAAELRREPALAGEYVPLVRRRDDGLFLQSFAVAPLRLPGYRGDVAGILPVAAEAAIASVRRRHDAFRLVQGGKTRVNDVPGYTVSFTARDGRRRLFGRSVLLPAPAPGTRGGVRLDMLATYAGGVSRAEDVGVRGLVKRPFRSFRFGTEGP